MPTVRPMSTTRKFAVLAATALVSTAVAVAAQSSAGADPIASVDPAIAFAPIGRYTTGLGSENAEIAAYDGGRIYVTNSSDNSLDIVDAATLELEKRVDLTPYGGGPNSVDARNGLVAVAVEADDKTDPGSVVFFNATGDLQRTVMVGALPDMVTLSPDGSRLLVANEGEPSDDYTIDPVGSVSIVDTRRFSVQTVGFERFNARRQALLAQGVRIFGPGASVAQDLEPEYITVAADGKTAWISLQEANAIAVLNLSPRSPIITRVVPLGTKDHSLPGNGFDASDRDRSINIATRPVEGMYQPDALASFMVDGETYLVSANEGDARDYDGFSEESRVKDLDDVGLPLDLALAPFGSDRQLGRLTVTSVGADSDGDGDSDRLLAFGARSFSIWNSSGDQVWDSGDDLERITASVFPASFNAGHDSPSFDNRSDNKGPEPEAAATAVIDGRTYAFIGLERIGGMAIYDVSVPTAPEFVQYTNTRDFVGDEPDLGPESIEVVPADQSPSGRTQIIVANEISATVLIYEVTDPDGATTLSLLHNNDGESALLPIPNEVRRTGGLPTVFLPVGGVASFATITDQQIGAARAAGNSLVNVYAGDSFLASATLACSSVLGDPLWDAIAQRQIPFDAHILGNHEFDYTPDFLQEFIETFEVNGLLTQPFLSANLDFSGEPGFTDLVDGNGIRMAYRTDGRVVAQGAVIVDDVTGQRFGVVGATTPTLPTISSPRNVAVTPDLESTRAAVQQVIDRMRDEMGITKIVFVSHLQDLNTDKVFVPTLRGVDLAVGGGGDELLVNNLAERLPGETQPDVGDYPVVVTDGDGRTVYIVTTPGNYKYLGRLDVVFDDSGEVTSVDTSESRLRRVIPPGPEATTLGVTDTTAPKQQLVDTVTSNVRNCLAELEATPVARTAVGVDLDVSRDGVRSRATNGGDLIADSFLDTYTRYGASVGGTDPVIAVQNGGGIRQNGGDVLPNDPTGRTISQRDSIDVLPFDNFMVLVQDVTPAELKTILERSAASLPGQGGQFLQIAGFTVTYDVVTAKVAPLDPAPANVGNRVVNVTLADGSKIIENRQIVPGAPNVDIVTNNFTAAGGDNYPTFATKTAVRLRDAGGGLVSYEQAFREYLQSFSLVDGLPTVPDDGRYTNAVSSRISITIR